MERRVSVLLSSDIFSKVPGAVLSILWIYKKIKNQDKEHRKKGRERRKKGERL